MLKISSLTAGVVVSLTLSGAALAADSAKPSAFSVPSSVATVVGESSPVGVISLTTSEGHALSVEVDGYGAFNSATFTPVGLAAAETTSVAYTFFSPDMQYLRRDYYGDVPVRLVKPFRANSTFEIVGVSVQLKQILREITGGVSLLQTYTLLNKTTGPITVSMVRYHDIDLMHSGTPYDDIGVSYTGSAGAGDPEGTTTKRKPVVLLNTDGSGADQGWAVRPYSELGSGILNTGSIPDAWRNVIANDANGDNRADYGYDLAAAAGRQVTLAAGGKAKMTFRTNFMLRNMP